MNILMGSYLYFILDAFVYSVNFVNHSISQPIDGKLTELYLTGRIKQKQYINEIAVSLFLNKIFFVWIILLTLIAVG